MSKVFIAFCLIASCALADNHDDFVHAVAHVGASYVVNDFTYSVMHAGLGAGRTESAFFAGVLTFTLGAAYKMTEQGASSREIGHSLMFNAIGIGLDDGVIHIFGR